MSELTSEKIDNLIELCTSMLNQSYCPYSRFAVGAVLVTDCGKIFTGKLILSAALEQYIGIIAILEINIKRSCMSQS